MIEMFIKIVLHVFQCVVHALLLLSEYRDSCAQFVIPMVDLCKGSLSIGLEIVDLCIN